METVQPTPERLSKGDLIEWEETVVAGQKAARVRTQTVLDRYFWRQEIDPRQYEAGQKLYRLFRAAGQGVPVSAGYDVKVQFSQGEMTDRQADAYKKYQSVLVNVGKAMAAILVAVCLVDEPARDWMTRQGEPGRAGITVLRLALDALGDAFGMPREV